MLKKSPYDPGAMLESYQEWMLADVALVEDDTNRKQVDLCFVSVASSVRMVVIGEVGMEPHFRRKVARSSAPGSQKPVAVQNARKPVVRDLYDELGGRRVFTAERIVQQDIGWFHVTLDDSVVVEDLHCGS